jgi:RNA polymerase sigma factor (sigma-70 family)
MKTSIELSLWKALGQTKPEKAFSSVYKETSRLVWTVCFRILKSQEDASDAYQGAYARLFQLVQSESQPLEKHSVESLMMRLAVLEADRLRKQRGRRQDKEVAVESYQGLDQGTSKMEEQLAHQQLREKLELVIEELPENLRVPVVLHYLDGVPQKQIAQALGVSPVAIHKRLKRALEELRPKCRRVGLQELSTALAAVAGMQVLLSPPAALAEGLVLSGALQLSQSTGVASISLSTLEPAKGAALLGGKAMIATVAGLLVIISLTLVGAISGKSNEKAKQPSVPVHVETGQVAIDIESDAFIDEPSVNGQDGKDISTDQDVVTKTIAAAELKKITLQVLWKETNEPVEGVALSGEGIEEEVVTDEKGMISLDNALEEGVVVSLNHPEAINWATTLPKPEEGQSIVYLEKAGMLSGILAYGDGGKLAENKQVRLYFTTSSCAPKVKLAETTTDTKGRYQFPVQKLGTILVRANDGVYIDRTECGTKLELNASKAGEDIPAPILLLEQGASVFGKVTSSTGKPIAGVEVKLDFRDDLTVLTNADGEYELSPLFPGSHRIQVTNIEYVPYQVNFDLDEREAREIFLTLEDGGKLKVTVLDEETITPVSKCQAININDDYRHLVKENNVTGELLVWGLKKDIANAISIDAPGYKSHRLNFSFSPGLDYEETTVTLEKDSDEGKVFAVNGYIYTEDGTPVHDATVSFGMYQLFYAAQTSTNAEGYFSLHQTKGSSHALLIATKEGYQSSFIENPQCGTPEKPATHNLIMKHGHWIDLVVQDENGTLLNDAKVSLERWYPNEHHWHELHGARPVAPQTENVTHRFEDLPNENVRVTVLLIRQIFILRFSFHPYRVGFFSSIPRAALRLPWAFTFQAFSLFLHKVVFQLNTSPTHGI